MDKRTKELYDKKDLVGIKEKSKGFCENTEEKNTTGFFRRPVKYGGMKQKNLFSSKDFYIGTWMFKNVIRTFDEVKGWQGEVKEGQSGIGGGILESID